MKKLLVVLLVIGLALIGFGCGGSGGGSTPSTPSPISNESASGFWNGYFHSNVLSQTFSVSGGVTENNEIRIYSATWGGQYAGNGTVSGNSFVGTLTAYAPWGDTFPDGTKIGTASISGTVKTRISILGSYSGTGDNGTFALTFDSIYLRPSSLSLVSGNWFHNSPQLGSVLMTIDASGNITGITSSGCVYSGNVSLINPSFNAYRASINISSCGALNGNNSGLAMLDDMVKLNDTLIASVSNPSEAFTALFIRQ